METSKMVICRWRQDIRHHKLNKVVNEMIGIVMLFNGEQNKNWIECFKQMKESIKTTNDRILWSNEKKKFVEFIDFSIEVLQRGKTRKEITDMGKSVENYLRIARMS